jgi:arsenical pump membrane protein
MTGDAAVWLIALATVAAMIGRPFRLPEYVWALAGAALAILAGLISPRLAWAGVLQGDNVYMFLAGMMLLSETARREGVFDWVAALAVDWARGSRTRLFALVFGVGVLVTAFLSNDATAVVLTPAVLAVARAAKAPARPYLIVCAMVANTASFILPISNPANLVLYQDQMPSLVHWLLRLGPSSASALAVTFLMLRWTERGDLTGEMAARMAVPRLGPGGWTALIGLCVTGAGLMIASGLGAPLGPPTLALGAATAAATLIRRRESPLPLVGAVHWSILPLVAGLFVLVEALQQGGAAQALAQGLDAASAHDGLAAGATGILVALADNLANNLPVGLLMSKTLNAAHAAPRLIDSALIGVDVGPNLSITGSLATILWLTILRKEGQEMSYARFFAIGARVMPPALLAALAARALVGG